MSPVLLDSGAFVASRKGQRTSVDQYAQYLLDHGHKFEGYFNLDVIPRSWAQAEEAALQGWENYLALKDRGLNPIPVYHYGERWYWLEKMIDEGANWIGIGGIARVSTRERIDWLWGLFSKVRGVRLHGLGVTGIDELSMPWYSVDSSSWVQLGAYGSVFLSRRTLTEAPITMPVTRESSGRRGSYFQYGPAERAYADRYFAEFGLGLEDLQGKAGSENRLFINAGYYYRVAHSQGVRIFFVGMPSRLADRLSKWAKVPVGTLIAYSWARNSIEEN